MGYIYFMTSFLWTGAGLCYWTDYEGTACGWFEPNYIPIMMGSF